MRIPARFAPILFSSSAVSNYGLYCLCLRAFGFARCTCGICGALG